MPYTFEKRGPRGTGRGGQTAPGGTLLLLALEPRRADPQRQTEREGKGMEHKAPEYCRHPERRNCRQCPDSEQPPRFDGLCKWLRLAWDQQREADPQREPGQAPR